MVTFPVLVQIISMVFFGGYGASCFLSQRMKREFERYQVASLRRLTGILQITAAFGLGAGFFSHTILLASSIGLTLMMAVAVFIRIRIRDSFLMTFPAIFFFGLNLYLVIVTLSH